MFPDDLSRETRNLAFLDPSDWLVLHSLGTLMLKASLFIKNRDIFSEIKNHSPAGHAAERTKINESKMAKEKLFVMIHGAILSVRNNDQIIFKSYSFYDITPCSVWSSECNLFNFSSFLTGIFCLSRDKLQQDVLVLFAYRRDSFDRPFDDQCNNFDGTQSLASLRTVHNDRPLPWVSRMNLLPCRQWESSQYLVEKK